MTTKDSELKKYSAGWRAHLGIYRTNARNRGIPWKLSPAEADTLFRGECHYCGEPPEQRSFSTSNKNPYVLTASGIDRVDNTGEYITGNVVSACKACNKAKGYLGYERFLTMARRVAARFP